MTNLNSKIEWTDSTWSPVTGCTKVSAGCDHCYAEKITERFHGKGSFAEVKLHHDRLEAPLRWRKPRRVFVNSMSDLFHPKVPDEFIAKTFAVMAATPQHTYQILTKRHGRMRSLLANAQANGFRDAVAAELLRIHGVGGLVQWPLFNAWLGVSVEDQQRADLRIPALLDTPAAVRFLSCEPLLGPLDLSEWLWVDCTACSGIGEQWVTASTCGPCHCAGGRERRDELSWVIVGGESGSGARPMRPDWARSLRDQCSAAGVPFFFKQWGAYRWVAGSRYDSGTSCWADHGVEPQRVGKKAAGRKLDGREWNEFPAVASEKS